MSFLEELVSEFSFTAKDSSNMASDTLLNLVSMVKTLGPPTFFMTLTANDNWPELFETLKSTTGLDESDNLHNHIKYNPLFTALHFERRWNALLKHVLKGPDTSLGTIVDYFARVEFQNRGSPHLHIFIWVMNFKPLKQLSYEEIVSFIDKHISTTIPLEQDNDLLRNLVLKLQKHSHTQTCQLKHKTCRFGFPHSACSSTRLITMLENVDEQRGKFYETKRSSDEGFINAYSPCARGTRPR